MVIGNTQVLKMNKENFLCTELMYYFNESTLLVRSLASSGNPPPFFGLGTGNGIAELLNPLSNNRKRSFRVDFDVPMKDGVILSKQRIVAALDSINYVLNNYCRAVILISHLGKPHGKRKEKYSLKPIQKELSTLLNKEVIFLDDCVGPEVEMAVMEPEEKSVFLLENVQFHPEELGEADGKGPSLQMIMEFRRSLRRLAEVYVNDTFSLSHLKHSSMLGEGYEVRAAGFLVLKELENFHDALIQPEVPFLAILGGDSLTDILPLMEALLLKVNEMIIAGGIVFTFLKVLENMEIGDSLFDPISAKKIPKLMEVTKERKIQIHYPDDFWVAASPQAEPMPNPVRREKGIKPGYMGLDIGPKTLKNFAKIVRRAKILIWNGPVGAYDYPNFAQGTKEMVDYVVDQTVAHGITMINGEATVKAFEDSESTDQVTFISHGDDAAVALLKGRLLPSITSLTDADVYCRQKCKVFQVIRPEIENNPFGEVDVEKIRAERRQKREEEAQEAAGKETNKKNTVGGQNKTGSQPGKASTTSSLGGSQGARGSTGSQGARGSTGSQGARGSTGSQGARGSTGSQGARGSTGSQGARGSTGSQGARGSTGSQGERGSVEESPEED